LQRLNWSSLNGIWQFAFGDEASTADPARVNWQHRITVPFAPETEASGVGRTGFLPVCWYRRLIPTPARQPGERVLLHFGAVDYRAVVWVNGRFAGSHEGGYTPFALDITTWLNDGESQEIIVRADDDPHDLTQPRGKQDWRLEPHSIWYVRTSGIWQSVWIEVVPAVRIDDLRWTSSLERWELGVDVRLSGAFTEGLRLHVHLTHGTTVLADDTYALLGQDVHRRLALADPGIDDYRNELLWSPETPTLIDALIELQDATGQTIDRVGSYTALREVSVDHERFLLNGRPYPLRLVLDQGYWPDSGLTAPDDHALRRDVLLAKAMGFNGVRKHQKIEDPRYLYWADRLGLLVWEEMPSAYRFTTTAIERVTREWVEVIRRDRSHPCIVTWVPFNESWGVPNLPSNRAERHFVHAVYHLTRTLDPTRPVVGNDGWESVATDIIGIHDYDADVDRLRRRYGADEARPRLFRRERPAGRVLVVDKQAHRNVPIVLSEFGGLSLADPAATTWGYASCESLDALADRYTALLQVVRTTDTFAGFCYTQFADTYQEANGLLRSDRTPKIALETIAAATCESQAAARAATLMLEETF
jgi:beta-galactosidase/beta-glucuronidase